VRKETICCDWRSGVWRPTVNLVQGEMYLLWRIFSTLPTQKNLEANLKNHLGGLKHEKAIEDFLLERTDNPALSSGRRGRPARPHKPMQGNQSSLHSIASYGAIAHAI
jgi:hypothetical protein